jgi:hypothetical protein
MSFPPVEITIARGLRGVTTRPTYRGRSAISPPPKPRLIVFRSGKDAARSHMRIVELPKKTTWPGAGGVLRASSSKAFMVGSHRSGFGGCCPATMLGASALTRAAIMK